MAEVMQQVAVRLRDNYPYFHPFYAGQMLKPPHPIARAAYALATWINPNNHALDGGRASSAMEKEAVAEIAAMFGWQTHLGHLSSGGTMANLEALWVAGQLHPGKKIAASAQAHYTHHRISSVLGLPFAELPCDPRGRMDTQALAERLAGGDIGCVVATLGTTGTGSVDPLPEILRLRAQHGFRLHVDAAYGGYFTLAGNLTRKPVPRTTRSARPTPLSLIPTSMACNLTGAGACCFAIRVWGRCTNMIPPTPTSPQRNCIWVKSAWNVRARELRPWRCGPPKNCCPSCAGVSSPPGWRPAGKPRSAWRSASPPIPDGWCLFLRSWISSCGRLALRSARLASERSQRIFAAAAKRGLHLALIRLPVGYFPALARRFGGPSRDGALPAFCVDEARAPRMAEPDSAYPGRGVPGCSGGVWTMMLKLAVMPNSGWIVPPAGNSIALEGSR